MKRVRLAIAATLLTGVICGIVWATQEPLPAQPVLVRFQKLETNDVGFVAVFTATNTGSHYFVLELSTERLVNGVWTAEPLGGTSGFGIVADHEQWRIHKLVPAGPEIRRGVVDCIRIPRHKLMREIDIFLGTYLRQPDVKVRCYSDEFHVPTKS